MARDLTEPTNTFANGVFANTVANAVFVGGRRTRWSFGECGADEVVSWGMSGVRSLCLSEQCFFTAFIQYTV